MNSYVADSMFWRQRVDRENMSNLKVSSNTTLPRRSLSVKTYHHRIPANPNLLRGKLFHNSPQRFNVISERDYRNAITEGSESSIKVNKRMQEFFETHSSFNNCSFNSGSAYTYEGPAEVRGKYARPAVNVNTTSSFNDTSMSYTKSPVISRPVTSGSLVNSRRSMSSISNRSKLASYSPIKKRVRYKKYTPEKSVKPRERTPMQEVKMSKTLSSFSDINDKINDLEIENHSTTSQEDENPDQDDNMDIEDLERPSTCQSWKTTSSKYRQIEELENLLKKEKKVKFIVVTASS